MIFGRETLFQDCPPLGTVQKWDSPTPTRLPKTTQPFIEMIRGKGNASQLSLPHTFLL